MCVLPSTLLNFLLEFWILLHLLWSQYRRRTSQSIRLSWENEVRPLLHGGYNESSWGLCTKKHFTVGPHKLNVGSVCGICVTIFADSRRIASGTGQELWITVGPSGNESAYGYQPQPKTWWAAEVSEVKGWGHSLLGLKGTKQRWKLEKP